MNILLNGLPIKVGGGIVKFDSLVCFLSGFQEHKVTVVCNESLYYLIKEKYGSTISIVLSKLDPANPLQHFKATRFLDKLEREICPDAVITLFGPSFWRPKAFHLMGFAIPHYIYTESPFFKKISFKHRLKHEFYKIVKRIFFKRDADLWWTESDDVSLRLSRFLRISIEKIVTIWPNNHPIIKSSISLNNVSIEKIRLLTISAYYKHKNFEIYPDVIDECLKRNLNIELVTTIDKTHFNRINHKNQERWLNIGKVDIDSVVKLYNDSTMVFLPTLLECFSANYTEAMHFRRPIITSNLPFAKAACKAAALYFDPTSVTEICDCIENAILDRDKLISAGTLRLKELENTLPEQRILDCLTSNIKK